MYDPPMDSENTQETEHPGVGRGVRAVSRVTHDNTITRAEDDTERKPDVFLYYQNRIPDPLGSIEGVGHRFRALTALLSDFVQGKCVLDKYDLSVAVEEHIGDILALAERLELVEIALIPYTESEDVL